MSTLWRTGRMIAAWAVGLSLAGAGVASATINHQKKAKDLGFAATSCTYCHTDKLPKKDAAPLNDRGSWLKADKEKRGAKEIDISRLKDYVEKK